MLLVVVLCLIVFGSLVAALAYSYFSLHREKAGAPFEGPWIRIATCRHCEGYLSPEVTHQQIMFGNKITCPHCGTVGGKKNPHLWRVARKVRKSPGGTVEFEFKS